MTDSLLKINDLCIKIEDKQIVNGVSLTVKPGTVHAVMGPNGSGKSSLAMSLMGHPRYELVSGNINFLQQDIGELSPDKRAKLGMFLGMQHPYEIEGVPYKDFLRLSYNALYDGTEKQLRIRDFHALLTSRLALLHMDESFVNRALNVGFSGGEKKRAEVLQLSILQPKLAILDEIDSGLDVDALKAVCAGLSALRKENPQMSILLITHYPRILEYLTPDEVHIMQHGAIVKSGSASLAHDIEAHGFQE